MTSGVTRRISLSLPHSSTFTHASYLLFISPHVKQNIQNNKSHAHTLTILPSVRPFIPFFSVHLSPIIFFMLIFPARLCRLCTCWSFDEFAWEVASSPLLAASANTGWKVMRVRSSCAWGRFSRKKRLWAVDGLLCIVDMSDNIALLCKLKTFYRWHLHQNP